MSLAPLLIGPFPVKTETATVYRGANGRRYFSRAAAIRGSAKALFYQKHPCDCESPVSNEGETGLACVGHRMDRERFGRLLDRLVRIWKRASVAR